ncbi:hypothetical protein HDV62DRAFT_101034 [Trichoderma sp. SZMC 28011]
MDGMSFGWGAKSVGLSACLREWLREQLNIRAGRAGQVCCSSRPASSQTQGSVKKNRATSLEAGISLGGRPRLNLMLLYQVHVLHRSVYKQVHVWGTEQWVVVPVERSKEQLHQSTTLHANACIRSSHRHGRIRLGRRLANGGAPRLDPGTGCSLVRLRTLALSRRASKTTLRSPPLCMRGYSMDGTVRVTAACVRGCALAHVQHQEAEGWWALYVCCRLNLVQVAPLTLLAADPGTRATPGRFTVSHSRVAQGQSRCCN